MRLWILASILLAPLVARADAAECPMADGWYRRWVNCESRLRPLGADSQARVRDIVDAHTIESGSAVTWEEEADAVFQLLPEDLRRRESLDYIQCRAFETGRICKADWEARDQCRTIRKGSRGMEFAPGTKVSVDVRTGRGVDSRAATQAFPATAQIETSGGVRVANGGLAWDFRYGHGSARIVVPESSGAWTLAFDELSTRGGGEWEKHALGYVSGAPSPFERALRLEADLSIAWSCEDD